MSGDINFDVKTNALLQLLGAEASDKFVASVLASLSPEQRMDLAREVVKRWDPKGSHEADQQLRKILGEHIEANREDVAKLIGLEFDRAKPQWISDIFQKLRRGY